jgi:hypothetical protein
LIAPSAGCSSGPHFCLISAPCGYDDVSKALMADGILKAGFKDAGLSLREKQQKKTTQSPKEMKLPAKIGINLPQDLQPQSERTLALAAVYECNKKPDSTWEVSHEDELGHWIAIVGGICS